MRIVGSYVPENDELLYSFLLRLAEDNFLGIDYFAENFIDDRPGRPLPYKLSIGNTIYMPKIASFLGVDPLDFYLKTSLYPGTAPLQSAGKQSRIINFVFRENLYKYPLLYGRINQDITKLKYCPECRKEDINTHEHTWLRRAHHMPGVTVCWKHGVRLGTAAVDHKAKLRQLILPDMPVEEGAEEERQFAIFAKDFLESGPDLNGFLMVQMIRKAAETCGLDKMANSVARVLHIESSKFLQNIFKQVRDVDPAKLLAALFVLFQKVSDIPVFEDEYTKNRFNTCSSEYDLLSDYSGTIVKMRKHGEDNSFITTPYGFISGWRSPSEDTADEQEKFIQIVRYLRNDEYEPLDPFTGYQNRIRFLHKSCGQITKSIPRNFLAYQTSCQCRLDYVKNIGYPKAMVENQGAYELLYFGQDLDLTIFATNCGHFFRTDIKSWSGKPECRVCNRIKTVADDTEQTPETTEFLPTDVFKQSVRNLVGDEYEVVSDYINMNTPVDILHKRCGKVKSYLPPKFLRGTRCECDKKEWIPSGPAFCDYVYARSSGKYEASIKPDDKRYYIVKNTVTGETLIMPRQYIIQEFERQTKSDILPLDQKGEYQSTTIIGKVKDFILNNYKQGDEFNVALIKIHGLSKGQIHSAIHVLTRKNFIANIPDQEGLYMFTNGLMIVPESKYADKGHKFKERVRELVGEDYDVTGEYVNSETPIEMRHNKCGETLMVKPDHFVHGVRCNCERGNMNKEEFIKFVHDKTNGLYEVQPVGNIGYYEIRNTQTGWTKKMTRIHILQEINRPTPSNVLK